MTNSANEPLPLDENEALNDDDPAGSTIEPPSFSKEEADEKADAKETTEDDADRR